jgi:hypothetical protein
MELNVDILQQWLRWPATLRNQQSYDHVIPAGGILVSYRG